MHITLVAGARPNFMKIAPLAAAFRKQCLPTRIVHTGQHYDHRMSEAFFLGLGIPKPDVNLEVGSGTAVSQIAQIMQAMEAELTQYRPDALVVVGDVNSTLAATLAACKMGIPVAHVEAGLRSFDRGMPEEVNRILVDAVADWLFASEQAAVDNLVREGVAPDRIHLVGNVMIDTLHNHLGAARERRTYERWSLSKDQYALLTLHRPSNVDDEARLRSILRAIHTIGRSLPVVFPVHPRTKSRLEGSGLAKDPGCNGFISTEPLDYHDMLCLMDSARIVLTDSGGMQEETTALGVPCLTLRENTERPCTVEIGSNQLVGWKTEAIIAAFKHASVQPKPYGKVLRNWDGQTSMRIATILADELRHSPQFAR